MKYTVIINGRLSGINELVSANRTNYHIGANLKKTEQQLCELFIARYMHGVKLKTPISIHYTFYEANKKRDHDNVSGWAHKVFQDALVSRGALTNDGWNEISGYSDRFVHDPKNPRIEILIIEEGENE